MMNRKNRNLLIKNYKNLLKMRIRLIKKMKIKRIKKSKEMKKMEGGGENWQKLSIIG